MSKGTPHKHAAVIKAWADGYEVEVKARSMSDWRPISRPTFDPGLDYRIKPEPSDLEKYGVQKGDVWRIGGHQYIIRVELPDSADCGLILDPRTISPGASSELMFRRGEVDKL